MGDYLRSSGKHGGSCINMDIFTLFSLYILTMIDLFAYCIGTRHEKMKINIQVEGFKCTCGSDRFSILTKDHLDKNAVMTCVHCCCKYRNDGAGEDGIIKIYRQPVESDTWELDERCRKVLN